MLVDNANQFAINVSKVTKCHLIFARPEDRLKQIVVPRLQGLLGRPKSVFYREFWALRELSLQVPYRQTLGIIGRNGAGKSTLLQILCGTLAPTTGTVETKGRIAALLELGSGFNPDFTGRENVYLNATVLGLKKHEIDERFEAIATFAGIGSFIDQPVKTYSSGMFVRLAFAVIAHVDADILIIDEALAVGDAVFTQKCMRFLRRFKEKGTLIFVSHDINSVINLCERAVWLDQGVVKMDGPAKQVAESYFQDTQQEIAGAESYESLQSNENGEKVSALRDKNAARANLIPSIPDSQLPTITLFNNLAESTGWHTGGASITEVRLSDAHEVTSVSFRGGDFVSLEVDAAITQKLESPIIGFVVKDRLGQSLFGDNTYGYGEITPASPGDSLTAHFSFTLPLLPTGTYTMTIAIADGTPTQNIQHHWLHDAVVLNVVTPRLWLGLVGIPMHSVSLDKTAHKRAHSQ
jgi:lipopolysaccharide transport system ATP-binding protein